MDKVTIFTDMNQNQSDGISAIAKKIGLEPTKNEKLKELIALQDQLSKLKAEAKDGMINELIDSFVFICDEVKEIIKGEKK